MRLQIIIFLAKASDHEKQVSLTIEVHARVESYN